MQKKPAAILELSGMIKRQPSRYKDMNLSEGVPVEASAIIPPKGISAQAKKAWDTMVPPLLQMRMLSETDLIQLDNLIRTYDELLLIRKKIKEYDKDYSFDDPDYIKNRVKLSGWLNNTQTTYTKLSSLFGLTPVDRTRLPRLPEEEPEAEDPLDLILN